MIYCPLCGGASKCYNTSSHHPTNTIRRLQKCKVCNHRFTTIEAVAATHVEPETVEAPAAAEPIKGFVARKQGRDHPWNQAEHQGAVLHRDKLNSK